MLVEQLSEPSHTASIASNLTTEQVEQDWRNNLPSLVSSLLLSVTKMSDGTRAAAQILREISARLPQSEAAGITEIAALLFDATSRLTSHNFFTTLSQRYGAASTPDNDTEPADPAGSGLLNGKGNGKRRAGAVASG